MFKPGPFATNDPCQSLLDITYPNAGREYIELYNSDCTNNIDISGWLLASKTGETGGMGACVGGSFCFPPGTIIPAGGFLSIGGGDESCSGCSYSYTANSIDIKLNQYFPSDRLCVCDNGQNYSGVWFLPNVEGWLALYEPDGTTHAAVYWATNEFNIYSVGNEFGFTPCLPTVYSGTGLHSATEISTNGEPIVYLGTGYSVNTGNTFSRMPDGATFQPDIPPSIGQQRALRCNNGTCLSCGNLMVTPFQDTCSMGKGRLRLEVPLTLSSPAPYTYNVTGPSGYNQTITTSANPYVLSGLFAGNYSITITDSQSPPATTTKDTVITNISDMVISSTFADDTCGQNIGTITLNVTGGVAPYNFHWAHTTLNSGSLTGLGGGTYSVTITGPNGVCEETLSFTLQDIGGVVAQAIVTPPSCFNFTDGNIQVNISQGEAPFQYIWSDSSTGTSLDSIGAGTYSLTITASNNCTKQLTVTVDEPSELLLSFSDVSTVCEGFQTGTATANVSGGTPEYTFAWSDGQTDSAATDLPAGTFSVTITDANSCTITDSVTIIGIPIPQAAFTTDTTSGCVPTTITFINNSDSGSYIWDFGNGIISTVEEPVYTYPLAGSYTISLIVSNSGCADTLIMPGLVQIHPIPVAGFSPSATVAEEENATIIFYDQSTGADSWYWTFGDQINVPSTEKSPTYTFLSPGTFQVCQAVANQWSCADTVCRTILVRPFISLYVPNAFSPNGDGLNDTFSPQGINFSTDPFTLVIYNRWGEIVFSSNGYEQAIWDGKYQTGTKTGTFVPQGIYIYTIDVNFESYPKRFTGTVSVHY